VGQNQDADTLAGNRLERTDSLQLCAAIFSSSPINPANCARVSTISSLDPKRLHSSAAPAAQGTPIVLLKYRIRMSASFDACLILGLLCWESRLPLSALLILFDVRFQLGAHQRESIANHASELVG
jgi:hypothetical protein